jgi:hypothetical protein
MLAVFETGCGITCITRWRFCDRRDHAARRWPRGGDRGLEFYDRNRALSGSLYALALSGVTTLGAITPLGGVAFIVGWISLAVAAF